MNLNFYRISLLPVFLAALFMFSCRNKKQEAIRESPTAHFAERFSDNIQTLLQDAKKENGKTKAGDSLRYTTLLDSVYNAKDYAAFWCDTNGFSRHADSLFSFIAGSKSWGLFPSDYHFAKLSRLHQSFIADSNARRNPSLSAQADLLLTDAVFSLVKDIKQGRLPFDSVTLRTDSTLANTIYTLTLDSVIHFPDIGSVFHHLEPKYAFYDSLRTYLPVFLASANLKPVTYLSYPYKDSVAFYARLAQRLAELEILPGGKVAPDTAEINYALRKYQQQQFLKPTGKMNAQTAAKLNDTDIERFKRIAVTLDRYKLLPDTLPSTRVWVNLPSFMLQVYDADTLVFQSRVIVGGPNTRTPLLTSEISNFITMPQWTVPTSIIFKEMLPKIQRNVEFLAKENLMVIDKYDSVVDPHTVNWRRLNKNHFPYQLKQRQGDDNSLGVIKFNFRNKYSVYLHDTNVRWLFERAFRALSHGCVRVKEWSKLAGFLIRNDSLRFSIDSVSAWIARQEKHTVYGFRRVPLYVRYFGCEGKDGHIKFYDDIYGEDKMLREKYFAGKVVE